MLQAVHQHTSFLSRMLNLPHREDCKILAAAARFRMQDRAIRRLYAQYDEEDPPQPLQEAMFDALRDALDAVAEIAAHTAEGRRAKADVLLRAFPSYGPADLEPLIKSLANDCCAA